MTVEILLSGSWETITDATAVNVETNRWLVTICNVPIWVRLTALDGAPLRIDGNNAFRVWGANKTNNTLVLDCLVV